MGASGTIMIVPVILSSMSPMTVACSTMVSVLLLWNRLRVPQTVQADHRPLHQFPIPMAMMTMMMMMMTTMMTMMMIRTSGGVVVVHAMMIRKSCELANKERERQLCNSVLDESYSFPSLISLK